jgi:hypothetical protein
MDTRLSVATLPEAVRFGKHELRRGVYSDLVIGEAFKRLLNVGVVFGFGTWFVAQAFVESPPANWVFFVTGAVIGAAAASLAPMTVRLAIERPSSHSTADIQGILAYLIKDGYEPIEISDKHCKLERESGIREFGLGPVSLLAASTSVMLVAKEGYVTIAAPCMLLPKLADLVETAQ